MIKGNKSINGVLAWQRHKRLIGNYEWSDQTRVGDPKYLENSFNCHPCSWSDWLHQVCTTTGVLPPKLADVRSMLTSSYITRKHILRRAPGRGETWTCSHCVYGIQTASQNWWIVFVTEVFLVTVSDTWAHYRKQTVCFSSLLILPNTAPRC